MKLIYVLCLLKSVVVHRPCIDGCENVKDFCIMASFTDATRKSVLYKIRNLFIVHAFISKLQFEVTNGHVLYIHLLKYDLQGISFVTIDVIIPFIGS